MKLCDVCKIAPARIQVTNEGDYCLDCYNAKVLAEFGKEDTFEYTRRITIMEANGDIHTFDIEHVILGTLVSWKAREVGGNFLESIETDDDYFPYSDIEAVCRTVDPFRTYPDMWADI